MQKVERLVNLIALLLETRRPMTADEIRAAIPGYGDQSDTAFRRMFERDKEELRELGIPVERAPSDVWEVEEGYRIRKERAMLPDLDLAPDEQAALWLAAQAWEGQVVGADPDRAVLKLSLASRAGGAGGASPGRRAEPAGGGWIRARVDLSTPVLESLFDAVGRRKRVGFRYRTGGAGEPVERSVDPYALRHRGAWYLTGFDHRRGEVRHFKVERIEGEVAVAPGKDPDFEAPAEVPRELPRGPWEGESDVEATVAFSPEAAWWVERRTGARRLAERDDGWVEVALGVADRRRFLSWVLGFADDAVVLSPEDLRAEVLERLERAAGGR